MTRSSNDGEAIASGGVRARAPVAAVGTAGLCMCSGRLARALGATLRVQEAQLHARTSAAPEYLVFRATSGGS
eukprot:5362584-Alexandrium_andersonii.AAC.1